MSIRLIWVVFERIRVSYVMSIRFVLMPFKDENLIFVSLSPSLDGVIQYCRATSCKKGGTDCISVRCFPTSDPYGLLRMEDGGTVALLAIKEVSTKSIDMRPKFVWVFVFCFSPSCFDDTLRWLLMMKCLDTRYLRQRVERT